MNRELLDLMTEQAEEMAADELMFAEYEESIKIDQEPEVDTGQEQDWSKHGVSPPDDSGPSGPTWGLKLKYTESGKVRNRNGRQSAYNRYVKAMAPFSEAFGGYSIQSFSNPDRMDQCRYCKALLPLKPSDVPCEFSGVPISPCYDEYGPIAFDRPCECNGCTLREMGVRGRGRPRELCGSPECKRLSSKDRQRKSRKSKKIKKAYDSGALVAVGR